MRIRSMLAVLVLLFNSLAFAAPATPTAAPAGKVKIGLLLDTLKEERWQKDRDLMVEHAKEIGADILVQAANGDDKLQYSQAENLLTQNVDVLIVVPHNGVTAAAIVNLAHKSGKKVISYDRLIKNSDVDLYVSFDNIQVGRIQGEYIVKHAPKGNYIWIGGAPTDPNSKMLRDGQFEYLTPAIKKGDIKIVAEQWAKEWQASEALKHTENALVVNKNNVTAVLAPNDGTAGGVISALKQQGLVGKVVVTGQDADLAACKRIADGSQTMTVYKPLKKLAATSIDAAVALAKGTTPTGINKSVPNDSKKEIPSILLAPVAVDSTNMKDTIIKDGFHTQVAVYGK